MNRNKDKTIKTIRTFDASKGLSIVEDIDLVFYTDNELETLLGRATIAALTRDEQVRLVNLAKHNLYWNQRFISFLKTMAISSSWKPKINALLDEFDYGTDIKEIIAAAKRYLAQRRIQS